MDLNHLCQIGIRTSRAPRRNQCGPESLRDARCQVPHLFASREARKGEQAAKALVGPRSECIDWIVATTSAAWTSDILALDFEERLGVSAATASAKDWFAICKNKFTIFSRGVATVEGFRVAVSKKCGITISCLVSEFLYAKMVKQAHPCWKDAIRRGGVVPLWQDEPSTARAATFDCLILEPFNPAHDPTYLLRTAGMHRIGDAITRLRKWITALGTDTRWIQLSFAQLEQITLQQQAVLRDLQAEVLDSVHKTLAPIMLAQFSQTLLKSQILPFGSLEIGMATASSDIDINVCVGSDCNIYSLVHACKEALESDPPSWLSYGSISAVLQTSKVPVLSFDYILKDLREMPRSNVLHRILEDLNIISTFPHALSCVSVDICFNNSLAVLETQFLLDTIGQTGVVYQIMLWLKYWTKSEGIDDSKNGALSSFGWRLIAIAFLMEVGAVRCLRDGFELVQEPPVVDGINVWSRHGYEPSDGTFDSFALLRGLCDELAMCVGSDKSRVFQVVTRRSQELDTIMGRMIQNDGQIPCSIMPGEQNKHMICLALPYGSGKKDILHELVSRLPDSTLVEWDGVHDTLDAFTGQVLDAFQNPAVRFVLAKFVPDISKLKLPFLKQRSVLCFHPPLHIMEGQAGDLLLLSQFRKLLQSNAVRRGSAVYVDVPDDLQVWPPAEAKAYGRWVEQVWAADKGLYRAFADLKAKSKRCHDLPGRSGPLHTVRTFETIFFNAVDTLSTSDVEELTNLRRLPEEHRAAERNRSDVLRLMNQLRDGTGIVGLGMALHRSAEDVAAAICRLLARDGIL